MNKDFITSEKKPREIKDGSNKSPKISKGRKARILARLKAKGYDL